jgi:drug/metabolite transporter (DMT)-like permease
MVARSVHQPSGEKRALGYHGAAPAGRGRGSHAQRDMADTIDPGRSPGTVHDSPILPRSTWWLLAALTFGWGFNWPMMKLALAEVPVWTFRGLCVAAGAAGMFAIAAAGGRQLLPPGRHWWRLVHTALLNVTLWNVFIAYGVILLPAGRAVILAYTMPLWAVLLSRVILHEPLTGRRALGVGLGTAGMLVLVGSELAVVQAAPLGALSVIAAALCWALGTVLIKRYPTALPTTSFTAWQLLIGGLPLVAGALLLDRGGWQPLSWQATAATLYNMVVAFVLCHWAWYKIVSRASAGVSGLGTLMIPVIGVLSSMLVLGERPGAHEYGALALVLAALATVMVPPRESAKQPWS